MIVPLVNRLLNKMVSGESVSEFHISKSQVTEFSWLTAGHALNLILGFLSIKLMTSVGPGEYGKFILVSSIMGILTLGYFGPLEQGYVRHYFDYANNQHSRSVFLYSLVRILQWSIVVLIVLAVFTVLAGVNIYNTDPIFIIFSSLMICIGAIASPIQGMMNALRLRKYAAIVQISEKILLIIFLAIILSNWGKNIIALLFCVILSTGIGLLLRFRIYVKQFHPSEESNDNKLRKEIWSKMIVYSLPFLLWGGVTWLQLNGERWVINQLLNTAEVGKYGLAATLLNSSAVIAATVLAQFITPIIFKRFSDNNPTEFQQGLRVIRFHAWITFLIFAIFAFIFLFLGEFIIRIISSSSFTLDTSILFFLSIGLGLFYAAQAMTSVGLALQKPKIYVAPKIITALASICAYYVGCRFFGIAGVVWAIVVINTIYLLLVSHENKKLLLSIGRS
jgi:O-antigen/teichoic acid export membrane protein